jgi:glycosyltransferase involved in cell wall biosynthesis
LSEIRVLIFTQKFIDDKLPGLQSKLFEEYQNLSKKIKLVIVSSIIKKNNYNNIRIVEARSKVPFFHKFFQTLSFLLAAIKVRNDYEIIFSRMLNPVHLLPAVVVTLFFKKKLVVWISGTSNLRKGRIEKKIIQMGLNFADYIGCSSEFQIREIECLGVKIDKNKVFYINPGVNLSKFKPERKKNLKEVILNVSRIVPSKGIEDSIKVIPFLKEKFPDLKLKIVGAVMD